MYIYIHISNHYISIYPKHIFLRYILYMTCFFYVSFISCRFFRAVWHHITSQSQQVMYYTSQLISWTLGQLAPWRKIRETCETDIHTRRIYIYVCICIYLYIWNNIYIICIHCIYIYIWMI